MIEQDMTIAETMNRMDLKLDPPGIWKRMTDEQKAGSRFLRSRF